MKVIRDSVIKRKYLLVDGYNVINAWPELKRLSSINLEEARVALVDQLIDIGAYRGEEVIVVFDAYAVKGKKVKEDKYKGVLIVYTKENQTADSYIEIRVEALLKNRSNFVRVVTSDWAEQQMVLGSGAVRVSPRELKMEVSNIKKTLRKKYHKVENERKFLEDALDKDVLEVLEKWRKKGL